MQHNTGHLIQTWYLRIAVLEPGFAVKRAGCPVQCRVADLSIGMGGDLAVEKHPPQTDTW